jgi:hypothetical protein
MPGGANVSSLLVPTVRLKNAAPASSKMRDESGEHGFIELLRLEPTTLAPHRDMNATHAKRVATPSRVADLPKRRRHAVERAAERAREPMLFRM